MLNFTDDRAPENVPQEVALNWYAAIFPEFYTKLFELFPDVFPQWLHALLPRWLESMQYFVAVSLDAPLFVHPMFQADTTVPDYYVPSTKQILKKLYLPVENL